MCVSELLLLQAEPRQGEELHKTRTGSDLIRPGREAVHEETDPVKYEMYCSNVSEG